MISNHDDRDFGSTQVLIANSVPKYCSVTAGDVSLAGPRIVFRSTTYAREAWWVMT
ncbi:MAG: hypothetical protein WAK24_09480 [Candidatus Acidiferrales bacterium]